MPLAKKKAAAKKTAAKVQKTEAPAAKKPVAKKKAAAAKKPPARRPIEKSAKAAPQPIVSQSASVSVTAHRISFLRQGVHGRSSVSIETCPAGSVLVQVRLMRVATRALAFWQGAVKSPLPEDGYSESLIGEVVASTDSTIPIGSFVATQYACPMQTYVVVPAARVVKIPQLGMAYLSSLASYANYSVRSAAELYAQIKGETYSKVLVLGRTGLATLVAEHPVNKHMALHFAARKLSLLPFNEVYDVVFDARPAPDIANATRLVASGGMYVALQTGLTAGDAEAPEADNHETINEDFTAYYPTQRTARYLKGWLESLGGSTVAVNTFTAKTKFSDPISAFADSSLSLIIDMVN